MIPFILIEQKQEQMETNVGGKHPEKVKWSQPETRAPQACAVAVPPWCN